MPENLPITVRNRAVTLASDLAELLAAMQHDMRYVVLLLIVTKSAEMVSACDRDALATCEHWLG